jgi:hypothetical protein
MAQKTNLNERSLKTAIQFFEFKLRYRVYFGKASDYQGLGDFFCNMMISPTTHCRNLPVKKLGD